MRWTWVLQKFLWAPLNSAPQGRTRNLSRPFALAGLAGTALHVHSRTVAHTHTSIHPSCLQPPAETPHLESSLSQRTHTLETPLQPRQLCASARDCPTLSLSVLLWVEKQGGTSTSWRLHETMRASALILSALIIVH